MCACKCILYVVSFPMVCVCVCVVVLHSSALVGCQPAFCCCAGSRRWRAGITLERSVVLYSCHLCGALAFSQEDNNNDREISYAHSVSQGELFRSAREELGGGQEFRPMCSSPLLSSPLLSSPLSPPFSPLLPCPSLTPTLWSAGVILQASQAGPPLGRLPAT